MFNLRTLLFLQSSSLASGCSAWGYSLLAAGFLFCHWFIAAELLEAPVRPFLQPWGLPKKQPCPPVYRSLPWAEYHWWINPLTNMVGALCLPGCSVTSPVLALWLWVLCIRKVSFFYLGDKLKKNPPNPKTQQPPPNCCHFVLSVLH